MGSQIAVRHDNSLLSLMKVGLQDLYIYVLIAQFKACIDDSRSVAQRNVLLVWFSNLVSMS